MSPLLIAALAALASGTPEAPAAAGQAPPATDAPAASEAAPTQVEGVTVKRNCRLVATTGARLKRRVCSDNPSEVPGADGVSGLNSTMHKSHQGNMNMSPRR